MDTQNAYMAYPGITPGEMNFIQRATNDLTDTQKQSFYMVYANKRRDAQSILLITLLGFIGLAGFQRVIVGQILVGIVYFFTGGFLFIGTIVDLINYKALADEYNLKMAHESFHIAKMQP